MDREPTAEERMNIILEDIRGKFDFIAEGLQAAEQSLRREIKEFRQENREEHQDFKRVMKSLGYGLSDHENRIKKLEKTVYH